MASNKLKIAMRKTTLIFSGLMLIGAVTFAQQRDTTKTSQQTDRTTQQSTDKTKTQTQQSTDKSQSDQMRNNGADDMTGWTRVNTSDVPPSMRQTLGGSQYKGWESGTVYRNQAGDTYSVQTGDKTSNNQKTYYFDKNGKATTRPKSNQQDH
jgi:hypothetical protein